MEKIIETLNINLRRTNKDSYFVPPDNRDYRWELGQELFGRQEVAALLWSQIAAISNDLKTYCGKDLTPEMLQILNDPRIPGF